MEFNSLKFAPFLVFLWFFLPIDSGQAHRRAREAKVSSRRRPLRQQVRAVLASRRHEAALRRVVRAPLRALRPWLCVQGPRKGTANRSTHKPLKVLRSTIIEGVLRIYHSSTYYTDTIVS